MNHIPVLLKEVLESLDLKKGKFVIDGTVNGGGHAREIIKEIMPGGKFLGVDWDKEILENTKREFDRKRKEERGKNKVIFVNDNYANLPEILKNNKLSKADAVLLDLGFSSLHIDKSKRGFSFQKDELLDMRYNTDSGTPAYEIINSCSEKDLADIFYKYGDERFSRRIAKNIVEARRKKAITTTGQLTGIINSSVPGFYRRARISPATKVFQALRIFVNGELDNLETFLSNLPKILKNKGRVLIISFHSLEDGIVKRAFREIAKKGEGKIITKKPIPPTREEVIANPKSRSSKLRVLEIIN
ncbi:MAG: 16S rRNA (cytosine(1402)-N(4))-methyltransferase RsmH [Candidatus Paceibacterota bacterium]|jgi:16S rRNA (cytosine1402-N4)-methyltransferase